MTINGDRGPTQWPALGSQENRPQVQERDRGHRAEPTTPPGPAGSGGDTAKTSSSQPFLSLKKKKKGVRTRSPAVHVAGASLHQSLRGRNHRRTRDTEMQKTPPEFLEGLLRPLLALRGRSYDVLPAAPAAVRVEVSQRPERLWLTVSLLVHGSRGGRKREFPPKGCGEGRVD